MNNTSLSEAKSKDEQPEISAESVAEYLKRHNEFFDQNPRLLTELQIPHASQGVASLVERQVSLLREHNIELRRKMGNLMEAARENDQLFQKTQNLSLSLVSAQNLEDIAVKLENSLKEEYNADCSTILLFDSDLQIENSNKLRAVKSEDAIEHVPGFIKLEKAICGHLRDSEIAYLFPDHTSSIGSAALVPFSQGSIEGLLAIGSFDAKHFHHRMGTMFITYIGNLVAHVMNNSIR